MNGIEALPTPLVAESASHGTSDAATQAHAGSLAVSANVPPLAAGPAATAEGATANVQDVTTFCTTGTTVVPMVIVALLSNPEVFAAASTEIDRAPVPLGAPTVNQGCDDVAVQSQNSLLGVTVSCPAWIAPPRDNAPGRTT